MSSFTTQRGPVGILLDRDLSQEYLAEWTAHIATPKKEAEHGTKSVVIFRVCSEWLAISVDMLQEVLDAYKIRPLPSQRSDIVRGLTNVRGELLICVALEGLLGIKNDNKKTTSDRLLTFTRGRFAAE